MLEYKKGKRCSFWFVNADRLRSFTGTTPPMLQELIGVTNDDGPEEL